MASRLIQGINVTGQDIIDVVMEISPGAIVELKDENIFLVGQKTTLLCSHLVLASDEQIGIVPAQRYEEVVVKEYNWGGMVFASSYSEGAAIRAMEKFAKSLESELLKRTVRTKTAERPIIFTFEGIEYECDQSAYEMNRIVLPDGRVLAVKGWSEGSLPQPEDLLVMDYPIATSV